MFLGKRGETFKKAGGSKNTKKLPNGLKIGKTICARKIFATLKVGIVPDKMEA